MNKLSVIIPTLNEEADIWDAIKSVQSISDDIVVVDSGSNDNTLKHAKALGARVYTNKFLNFANQRNFANSKTKNNWVLSMDADERIPVDLQKEILDAIKSTKHDAYSIPRRNIIFGREIKHTRWSPDSHVWLYDKTKGKWTGKVHEEFLSVGAIGKLKNGKIHYSHKTVSEFIQMINKYTEIESDELVRGGATADPIKMLFYSSRSFLGRYFYKLGFLDGLHGFVLSLLMAMYRFTTWAKVWEKQNL